MKKKIKILCTLGPSSIDERTILRLDSLGVDIFRLNLSHTEIKDLENLILSIKRFTNKPLCLDTEGAQIRNGFVENNKVYLKENSLIEITKKNIVGNSRRISFTPNFVVRELRIGDLISIDFESVLLQIIKTNLDSVTARVVADGYIGSNKAATVDRNIQLPVISEKDKEAIKIGLKHGLQYFALSFASDRKSVEYFRSQLGKNAHIISKIENREGVKNIDGIISVSDSILIDRGDLSREEPIERIPLIQKLIINKVNKKKIPVYVATNLLESMVRSKKPTRAEANDVINTLLDGADGLVLAAETAIGAYPINCTVMISKMIKQCLDFSRNHSLDNLQDSDSYVLIEPHGGTLVNRVVREPNIKEINKYKTLIVDETVLLDAEQIAIGAFSPLQGFMNKEEINSVLKNYKLPNGVVWPLPIFLQVDRKYIGKFKPGNKIALVLRNTNKAFSILNLEEIYTYDLDKMARETFRTNDESHYGVQQLKRRGEYFLSGKVDLIERLPSKYKHFEITPRQARLIFENKGWHRVVGFHTRNVAHRVHEYIQMLAFEKYHCDGLFIHPVIGPKKKGDYTADVILRSYELMIEKYYPKGKVFLAAFQNYSRYSGPREAVFTALCRKNFGCSHFIVGRDHTGVGNHYKQDDAHKLFNYLGDIGIVPIFFNEMHYCKKCCKYVEQCKHNNKNISEISGTHAREMFGFKKAPPDWFMRKEVSDFVLNEIKEGGKVFVE
ncbi:MAG: sulfate adenylyltransferase [Candidatus Omnitrophica bacterium]|nr:sulfate adenylyltransferase [Candidatus Omnitrophota bacterium]MDD5352409.1 sulfate adenylyltransferase [Candidatus Omnitrophota bacterium]MDD5550007.1 sulfate adenylyltransferase [Candidatus Omnitrophota bacterium]